MEGRRSRGDGPHAETAAGSREDGPLLLISFGTDKQEQRQGIDLEPVFVERLQAGGEGKIDIGKLVLVPLQPEPETAINDKRDGEQQQENQGDTPRGQ